MKVCFIESAFPPPFMGGKERQLYLVVQYLMSLGADVEVVTKKISPFKTEGGELECVKRFSGNFGILMRVLTLCFNNTHGNIVFYINTPSRIGKISTIICRVFGKKVVFKVSSENVANFICGDGFLSRYIRKKVSLFHVLSQKTFERLHSFGIDRRRIVLNYNGVEVPDVFINDYSLKEVINIVYAGRVDKNKNLLSIIHAVHMLNKRVQGGGGYNLRVCGDGPCLKEAVQYVEDNGLSSEVVFLGVLTPSSIHSELLASDYLALASFSEGMSNILLEAASLGVPIICSRVGAYKEILGDYHDFLTFDPQEAFELEEVLLKSKSITLEQRRAYGNYLRVRAAKVFSIQNVGSKILESFHSIN